MIEAFVGYRILQTLAGSYSLVIDNANLKTGCKYRLLGFELQAMNGDAPLDRYRVF